MICCSVSVNHIFLLTMNYNFCFIIGLGIFLLYEIRRCLLLGRNADKLRQCAEKQRHYSADKVHLVKAMVFPAAVYSCDSWTIKKAERWRTDAFELWCWRIPLRVLWTARRLNHSIFREINPEHSMEGLMLKLELQYFVHPMRTADSSGKSLMLGKIEDRRRLRC